MKAARESRRAQRDIDAQKVGRKVDRKPRYCSTALKSLYFCLENGAAYVTRTRDPIITNDVLYRLS